MAYTLKSLLNLTRITSPYRSKLVIQAYRDWLNKNDKILDIGCGNGITTYYLKQHFGAEIVGCDVKNYLIYNLPFAKIANGKIPFEEHTFDIALLNDVLHHIPKGEQSVLITEALRMAKKVLIFEAEPSIGGKIADVILNKFHYGDLKAPLTFRDSKEWQNLFKKMHLIFTTIKLNSPIWYPFSHVAFQIKHK